MGIGNPIVKQHMESLMGAERLAELVSESATLDPDRREGLIRRRLGEALEDMGAPYLIPFLFRKKDGRVSHYICFVSKHPRGYQIMKDIMAGRGLVDEDGVPMFEYVPHSGGKQGSFDRPRPLLVLGDDLRSFFAGQTLTMERLYEAHNVGTQFIKRNYKKVLTDLERAGLIQCEPDAASRKAGTFADRVLVVFP